MLDQNRKTCKIVYLINKINNLINYIIIIQFFNNFIIFSIFDQKTHYSFCNKKSPYRIPDSS